MDHERSWHASKYSSRGGLSLPLLCSLAGPSFSLLLLFCLLTSPPFSMLLLFCLLASPLLELVVASLLVQRAAGLSATGARNLVFVWTSYEEL
jgi:hypothetical protein